MKKTINDVYDDFFSVYITDETGDREIFCTCKIADFADEMSAYLHIADITVDSIEDKAIIALTSRFFNRLVDYLQEKGLIYLYQWQEEEGVWSI